MGKSESNSMTPTRQSASHLLHQPLPTNMNHFNKFKSLPILTLLPTISLIFYTTIFVFLHDWLGLKSPLGTANALIFSFLSLLLGYSFWVCVITDPGNVNEGYVPDVEGNHGESEDGENGALRMSRCDKCYVYKPLRTHHCRVCKRCILKMDHHCTWINNCVGYRNYKPFVLLVFYGALCSMYSTIIFVGSAIHKDWSSQTISIQIYYVICGVAVVGLWITLITLLGWHVYLLTQNMTSIEYQEGLRASWLARKSGQCYHHPYNLGAFRNITTILGPNVLKWLCPEATSHLKDGTSFPTSRDSSL
ncbi:hypothetical protein Droror1_Dr00017607 [Drosera rotundifolia]